VPRLPRIPVSPALIMSLAAGCFRLPGKPKMFETRRATQARAPAHSATTFSRQPEAVSGKPHTLVTVEISQGLLGRPVPSGLLPSWPSSAMDATTPRDALSISPKIV
jgi:hypothetical protein